MGSILRLAVLGVAGVLLTGCAREQQPQPPAQTQPPAITQGAPQGDGSSVAGIAWTIPSGWNMHPPRQMRVATYMIPAASGDAEGGECAVFYFGSDEGGAVQPNIDRWVGQFENPDKPVQATREVDGMKVTTVTVNGTYLAPGGPMMQSTGTKEGFRLLGAIVEGPEGSVFFKFTGPVKTVQAAQKDFDAMVASVKKQ